jgi:hypothetical protein
MNREEEDERIRVLEDQIKTLSDRIAALDQGEQSLEEIHREKQASILTDLNNLFLSSTSEEIDLLAPKFQGELELFTQNAFLRHRAFAFFLEELKKCLGRMTRVVLRNLT